MAGTVNAAAISGLAAAQAAEPPPRLRQTLDILPTTPEADGSPAWLLHDRIANRYFRIGSVELDLLALIDGRSAARIAEEARALYHHPVSTEDVEALFHFLRANNLVHTDAAQRVRHDRVRDGRPSRAQRLMHGYISFRLPLVRPDRFLDKALPWVRWLGTRWTAAALLLMGLLGLYLVSRQWDVFLATAVSFLSLEGIAGYALAIVCVKICHEFGHAFAAKARGLRVPTMGVAFIVFWPVAYTDTTDAWKLTRRRDRLAVGAGGVAVELGIAALSLLLWNLAPDGPVRAVLFLLATTSWFFSLLVNLNPLMRFDGYFLFSDLVGVPNLEKRSHADARYWLRRLLFGWDEPLGDRPPRLRYAAFGVAVWIYRFLLFLGIALAVYHLFFKTLGIVLFAIEIAYFILGPIFREVREWWRRKDLVRMNGAVLRTLAVLAALLLILVVPWRTTVVAPAMLEAPTTRLYMPEGARIERILVAAGETVDAGAPLVALSAPDLEHDLAQAIRRHDGLLLERGSLGVDALRRERALVIAAQVQGERKRIEGLRRRLDRLVLRAPVSGTVRGLRPDLAPGIWMADALPLLEVVESVRPLRLTAFVDEQDVARLETGATVRFMPEDGLQGILEGVVEDVDLTGLDQAPDLMASSFGGPLHVRVDQDGRRRPLKAVFRVTATITPPTSLTGTMVRGRAMIAAEPASPGGDLMRRFFSLLVREGGL